MDKPNDKPPGAFRDARPLASPLRARTLPLLILVFLLAVTGILWRLFDQRLQHEAGIVYADMTNETTRRIIERLYDYEQVLWGGVGLFNAKGEVTREDWHRYVSSLQLDQKRPGILGVGYHACFTPAEMAAHVRAMRTEGFPEYRVWPEGDRSVHTAVIYLEPFTGRNRLVLGYDGYTEATRRAAMDKARDSGVTAIAAKIILVQEDGKSRQNGMLMYTPVYRQGMPVDSIENRRQALRGFVYGAIRMDDFIRGTLKTLPRDIAFEVYANDPHHGDSMLFSNFTAGKTVIPKGFSPAFTSENTETALGRTWHFMYQSLPVFAERLEHEQSQAVLMAGIAISLLLAIICFLLLNTQNKAITLAAEMTRELRESEIRYNQLAEQNRTVAWEVDANGLYTYVNHVAEPVWGYHPKEIAGKKHFYDLHPEEGRETFKSAALAVFARKEPFRGLENPCQTKNGRIVWVVTNGLPILDTGGKLRGYRGSDTDITERKRAKEEQEKLQTQLNQAGKMESIGRLAGGVAHDFNNMLGVILGQTELAMATLDPTQELFADLLEIQKAARRSADLTRQLLAFARKQTAIPKVVDLNATVDGMLKMLHRLIGENLELTWLPGKNLWPVKIDPSQIDQILANLAVNARDAIADKGTVTITTRTASCDEACRETGTALPPGEYVMLSVSDTGGGMDQETQAHIFEPFFTTKATGEGTGLGLATVYGIVKQNHGVISVSSAPGKGTSFLICLPRHVGKAEQMRQDGPAEPVARGQETILLVEDEPGVLRLVRKMLEGIGYRVLAAGTPVEAIRMAEKHSGDIHLLITDVIMPEMNGRELAQKLMSLYPGLKSLFMSGYTADVISPHGMLDAGVHFIQKPFSTKELAEKTQEILKRP